MAEGACREWIPPAEKLTDDLLVEILSRVPYKSLCRLKCVSRRWGRVISHPDHRRLLPRYHLHNTIAGFFYSNTFTNVTGEGRPFVDPSLPFLPKCECLNVVDSCNGLLLCRCWRLTDRRRFDYLVVNPATEHWVVLPDSGWSDKTQTARLGFDPAVCSSHFHVFEFVEDGAADVDGNVDHDDYDGHVKGVEIYSSITGEWSHKDNGWDCDGIRILGESNSVFLDGVLHLITLEDVVAAVDIEGNTWRTIPMPRSLVEPFDGIGEGFIGLSRGYLYFVNTDHDEQYKVSVWVLEDYSSEQWIWKHTVSHLHLFRTKRLLFGMDYKVVLVHPEQDIIFLVLPHSKILMSYELDSREVQFICGIGGSSEWLLYLPYVPLYSESLADGIDHRTCIGEHSVC